MEKVFWPIVKPEKIKEFKKKWGDWLVLTDTIEDEKTPGKLKTEFSTSNGQMICLSPKSYYISCNATNTSKDGRKGIPNWIDLRLNDFLSVLYGENCAPTMTEVRSLRVNRDKRMTRTTTIKTGLSGIHVKLKVENDRVTCKPLQIDGKYI
jgi:hypothetical protein